MIIELTAKEIDDIKRALIIAMQTLDSTGNSQDILLSDRLELIETKFNKQ